MWPPRWSRRKSVKILIPVGGAVLLGGVGWLLGPLWAVVGVHGEALASIEPAVQIYRRLAVKDRNACLPSLAAALTRQAGELGHLDRIAEARAAAAEAEMISTDMLPSTQS